MRKRLAHHLSEALDAAALGTNAGRVEPDPADPDQQSLLIWYPKVTPTDDGYIRPAVKIESRAKSALDPSRPSLIRPYVADDLADIDLSVADVTTVVAERTFWDKVVMLHGLRNGSIGAASCAAAVSALRVITMMSRGCWVLRPAACG
jgi:hypothetical protein